MADRNKRYRPEELQQELGPGTYIKYSDMTMWDQPGEGGPDLYIFAPAMTEDELLALEDAATEQQEASVGDTEEV